MRSKALASYMFVFLALAWPEAVPRGDCEENVAGDKSQDQKILFTTPRSYILGTGDYSPRDFVTGDFNGDGRDDLLFDRTSTLTQTEIAMIFNQGNRELPPPSRVLVDFYGGFLVPSDFDGDRDLDLVVLNWYDSPADPTAQPHEALLLKNDGLGRLSPSAVFEVGPHPAYGTAADFDVDGDMDLAVSHFHQNKFLRDVTVAWNPGNGAFASPTYVPAVWNQIEIASGDLDGDGHSEIVVGGRKDTPPFLGGLVAVIPNLGAGRFGEPRVHEMSHADTVWTLQVGDVDRDGALDVVEGSANFGTITVLYNDGSGALVERVELKGSAVTRLRLGDLDGDGFLDIASRGGGVHLHTGPRKFAEPVFYGVMGGGDLFQLADVDADGLLDWPITQIGGGVPHLHVLYNRGGGRLTGVPVYHINDEVGNTLGWSAGWMVGGDFDRDGDTDLAVMGTKRDAAVEHVMVLTNRGDGTFDRSKPYLYQDADVDYSQQHLIKADLDGDGDLDLATCGFWAESGLGILWNGGDGTFNESAVIQYSRNHTQARPRRLAAADFDLDGHLDLVTSAYEDTSFQFSFFWNQGGRSFGDELDLTFKEDGKWLNVKDMATGDIDLDGDTDVVITHEENVHVDYPGKVTVLWNDRERRFRSQRVGEMRCWAIGGIAASDMDGDGALDLLASGYEEAQSSNGVFHGILSLFRNDGRGGFSLAHEKVLPVGSAGMGYGGLSVLSLGDIDQDGDMDLVTARDATTLQVLLNDGTGRLGDPVVHVVDYEPVVAVIEDLNGDGKMDVAITAREFGNVAVLLNEAAGPGSGVDGRFRRGDVDGDGSGYVLTDAILILFYLFDRGVPPACLEAADGDDDGAVRITDPVYLLSYHFYGGNPPPEPFRCCGLDPTPDSLGGCQAVHWSCR
jgi:hypothetical protein